MTGRKILIIGPSWVGDMVMAQSLFRLLKQKNSANTIHVLASSWTFPLLSCMPEVAHAVESPFSHGKLQIKERYRLAKALRHECYDQAIVLTNSFKSSLLSWWAKIPQRTGWLGEFRYGLLNDIRYFDKKRYPLMIEQFMLLGLDHHKEDLPMPYPYPSFYVAEEAQQTVLAKHQPIWRNKPVLALGAGAEFGPSKRWPPEYFAQVALKKLAEDWDVWLFGSHKDRAMTSHIMSLTKNRCENLAGRLLLSETVHLLSLTTGVVSNDSGLMHIAAALNKPMVVLYGATSPTFTPPLSAQATSLQLHLPCQPCFKRECPFDHYKCLRDLLPQEVLTVMATWGT